MVALLHNHCQLQRSFGMLWYLFSTLRRQSLISLYFKVIHFYGALSVCHWVAKYICCPLCPYVSKYSESLWDVFFLCFVILKLSKDWVKIIINRLDCENSFALFVGHLGLKHCWRTLADVWWLESTCTIGILKWTLSWDHLIQLSHFARSETVSSS